MKSSATASPRTNPTSQAPTMTSSATAPQEEVTYASESRSAEIARQILECHKRLDGDMWPKYKAFEDEYTKESIAGQHLHVPFHTWALRHLSIGVILGILEAHLANLYEALPARHKGYIERLQEHFELPGLWNLYFLLGYQTIQSRDTMEVLARIVKCWPDEDLLLELEIVRAQRISLNTRGQRKSLSSFQLADAKSVEVKLQKRMEETEAQRQKKKAKQHTYVSPAPTDATSGPADNRLWTAQSNAPQPPEESPGTSDLPSPPKSLTPSIPPSPCQEQLPDTDIPDSPHGSIEIGRDNVKDVEHFEEDSILQDRDYSHSLRRHSSDTTSSDNGMYVHKEWHGGDVGLDIGEEDTNPLEYSNFDVHSKEGPEYNPSMEYDREASVPLQGGSDGLISEGTAARNGLPKPLAGEDDSTFTFQLNLFTESVSVQRKVFKTKHAEQDRGTLEEVFTAESHDCLDQKSTAAREPTIDSTTAYSGPMNNDPTDLSPNVADKVIFTADQPTAAWKAMYTQNPATIKSWETSIKEHQMLRDDLVHFLSFSENCLPDILVLHPLFIQIGDNITLAKHPAKFLRYRLLLVPLYHPESKHFSLAVVDIPARSMIHYDSLESCSRFNLTKKHVLPWMASIFAESSSQLQLSATPQKCFQQSDGVSCGLLVAAWANYISQNLDVPDTWDVEFLREHALNRLKQITPDVDVEVPLPPSTKAPVCIDLESEDEPPASNIPSMTDGPRKVQPADIATSEADKPHTLSSDQMTTLDALQACLAQASVLMAQYHSEKGEQVQELEVALQSDRERESSIQTELPIVSATRKRLREEHYVTAESGRLKREKYSSIKTYFASTLALKPDTISDEDIALAVNGQRAVLVQIESEIDTLDQQLKHIASGVDAAQRTKESCEQELLQLSRNMEHRNRALERQNRILQAVQKLRTQSEDMKGTIRGFAELDSEESGNT